MNTSIQHRPGGLRHTEQLDYILLDGSGSMQTKWYDSLAAIDAYVETLKKNNVNSQVMLTTFDSREVEFIHRDVEIANWQPLAVNPIGAYWSSTPLYDAIALMGLRLRNLDPKRASIVIVTDGEENASRVNNLVQAKAILDWMRAKGWQVTFIGANFNNAQQARMLGADEATAIGVSQKLLPDAARALAEKRTKYGLYGTDMHFDDGERNQFGGFLGGPSAS